MSLSSTASCSLINASSVISVCRIPISTSKDNCREKICPNAERGGWPEGHEIRCIVDDNSHIPANSPPLEITTIVASCAMACLQASSVSSVFPEYEVAIINQSGVHQLGRSYPL